MTIELRPTTSADLDRVIEIEGMPESRSFITVWPHERHEEAMADPDFEHLVVIDDGDIVGEVILHDIRSPHNRMEIWKIAVAAPGKGVGRKALELAVDRCFDVHGAHRVWLDLKLYNDRARRVYEALGFVSEGIARDSYLYEGEYESLEIMSVLRPEWEGRVS